VDVILPLHLLIGNIDNRYQLSAAAIRRAHQLALTGDEDVEANKGKIVSTSIQQILTKKVKYQIGP
jgi:DNA-directed RNA polymerase subunit omega